MYSVSRLMFCGGYVSTRWGHQLGFLSTGVGLQERIPFLPVPTAILHKPNPLADVPFGFFLASLLFIAIVSAATAMLPEVVAGWVTQFTLYGMLSYCLSRLSRFGD